MISDKKQRRSSPQKKAARTKRCKHSAGTFNLWWRGLCGANGVWRSRFHRFECVECGCRVQRRTVARIMGVDPIAPSTIRDKSVTEPQYD